MYGALAVILIGLAACSVLALRVHRSRGSSTSIISDQLKGFVYVGSFALWLLAITVVLVGLLGHRAALAEGLAMFGFFTYVIYLLAAYVVVEVSFRREPMGQRLRWRRMASPAATAPPAAPAAPAPNSPSRTARRPVR